MKMFEKGLFVMHYSNCFNNFDFLLDMLLMVEPCYSFAISCLVLDLMVFQQGIEGIFFDFQIHVVFGSSTKYF